MGRFLISLCVILFAFASSVQAQEAAYQLTVPPGWLKDFSNSTGVLLPPEGTQGGVTILVLTVQPLVGNAKQIAETQLKSVEVALHLNNPRYIPVNSQKSDGAEIVVLGGTYESQQGQMTLMLMLRFAKGKMGGIAMIANSQNALTRYGAVGTAVFANLRFADEPRAAVQVPFGASSQAQAPVTNAPSTNAPIANTQVPSQPAAPPITTGAVDFGQGQAIPPMKYAFEVMHQMDTNKVSAADLVGIWTNSAKNSHTYNTSGWNIYARPGSGRLYISSWGDGAQYLKVRRDGTYELMRDYYLANCRYYHLYSGRMTVQNGMLILQHATAHEIQGPATPNAKCDKVAYDRTTVPQPDTFKVNVRHDTLTTGYKTYGLQLTYVGAMRDYHTVDYLFERLESLPVPAVASEPSAFPKPQGHAAGDLHGTWVAPEDTPANFVANGPGDGKFRAVMRLFPDGRYEISVQSPDVMRAPACTKHLTLMEQGEALFAGRMLFSDNRTEGGTMMLRPTMSRMTSEVINCGPDNNNLAFDLPLAPRYLRWRLTAQVAVTSPRIGDTLSLSCPGTGEPTSAWNYLRCPDEAGQVMVGYVRR